MTDYQSCSTILPPDASVKFVRKKRKIRTLVAYWILGLCNNYGYVVMLTAANDIISENSDETQEKSEKRDCTYMSTGAILLADILPGLTVKILAPFLPFFVQVIFNYFYILKHVNKHIFLIILTIILIAAVFFVHVFIWAATADRDALSAYGLNARGNGYVRPSARLMMCESRAPKNGDNCVRVAVCVLLASAGFLTVAFSNSLFLSILGVVLTSFCSGFGEATYLQYSSFYDRNVISSWSSGTGGAGVIGALSYSLLQAIGMRTTLLIMLVIPASMAISFWVILPKPSEEDIAHALEIQKIVNREETKNPKAALKKKLQIIPGLMKYIIPFSLVYLFEYFINQGTFELIQFKDSSITQQDQYRWLQVTYQVGVFLSRSSVNLFHIRQTWIMTVFQGINVVIFTTEVIYYYIPNFYIVIALVLWEGLLGGSSYVNTFYRISTEVPEENKQFSMAITTFGDSIGIALAGAFAIYAHNKICDLPMP